MVGLVEEITLLLLRDEGGAFVRVPTWSLRYSIAGGVLMELADANRIDTDLEHLFLVDDTPTGDELLDPTLAEIAAGERQNTRFWIEHVAEGADGIREAALGGLVAKGILTEREERVLWLFKTRRYPAAEGSVRQAVKLRLMEVLLSDDIPDPRDVMLICLADACGIFRVLLSGKELASLVPRIEQVTRLDLIGQTMVRAIDDVRMAVAAATAG
ncbi:MAG: GPP34 family phosphoprotein, partial [bacterium]|nr:GPP34 family phosphoprotein [bacterium]